MNPHHLGERKLCFGDYQKLLDNGDWIGNLLEHLQSPKHQSLGIGERDE